MLASRVQIQCPWDVSRLEDPVDASRFAGLSPRKKCRLWAQNLLRPKAGAERRPAEAQRHLKAG